MTDNPKKNVAEAFIAALGAGNKSALQTIMVDDVVWSLPGSSTMSGEARGASSVPKFSIVTG